MTDEEPEKRDGEELSEEEAVERLRKLLGEQDDELGKDVIQEVALESELEEIGRQIAETTAEAKSKTEGIDAEFEERISSFSGKVDAARAQRKSQTTEQQRGRDADADSAHGLGIGLSIAYTIIGFPLAGALIGWFVDQQLGTQIWKGFGLLIAAVLAIFMAILILRRSNTDK